MSIMVFLKVAYMASSFPTVHCIIKLIFIIINSQTDAATSNLATDTVYKIY